MPQNRYFMLALLAGTAFPASANPTGATLIPVMPEHIEDSCGLYVLLDSSTLVEKYTAVRIEDLDGDGAVTDADFVTWIENSIAPNLIINDIDEDGFLTAVDEVAALATVLDKLSGDLNADGVVTIDDTALFLDLFITPPAAATGLSDQSADVTLDGAVTADDLSVHVSTMNLGTQTDRVGDAVKVLITLPGSLTRLYYTQGHNFDITRTWGPERHHRVTSGFCSGRDRNRYPPNHSSSLSITWPENHRESVSSGWPAQHSFQSSEGWGRPGDDPDEHRYEVSAGWPAHHIRAESVQWNEPPHGPHDPFTSSRWPPNHEYAHSSEHFVPPHDPTISAIITDPNFPADGLPDPIPGHSEHDNEFSQTWVHHPGTSSFFWPPQHIAAMSNTWSTHSANVSQYWPANHHFAASQSWVPDDDGNYPWWPANHSRSTSDRGRDPADPPPPPARPWWLPDLFPPGHDVSTTIQQWLPFFPD